MAGTQFTPSSQHYGTSNESLLGVLRSNIRQRLPPEAIPFTNPDAAFRFSPSIPSDNRETPFLSPSSATWTPDAKNGSFTAAGGSSTPASMLPGGLWGQESAGKSFTGGRSPVGAPGRGGVAASPYAVEDERSLFPGTSGGVTPSGEGAIVTVSPARRGRDGRRKARLKMRAERTSDFEDRGEAVYDQFAGIFAAVSREVVTTSAALRQFEDCCRELSLALREEATGCTSTAEAHVLIGKSAALLSEAATWALLYHLFGYGTDQLTSPYRLSPSTSQQDACNFLSSDPQAQHAARVLHWLEGLADAELALMQQERGSCLSEHSLTSGLRLHTRRVVTSGGSKRVLGGGSLGPTVTAVDPDVTTRQRAALHPEDERQEELLLEDVFRLIKAGRAAEALDLCRAAGQAWRAATLGSVSCPDPCLPDVSSWQGAEREGLRGVQASEMDAGKGRSRRVWKWALYIASEACKGRYEAAVYASMCGNVARLLPACTTWESACWALTRTWLDFQLDAHLSLSQLHIPPPPRSRASHLAVARAAASAMLARPATATATGASSSSSRLSSATAAATAAMGSSTAAATASDGWPAPIADQQPSDFADLFQRLESSSAVPAGVRGRCSEPHHVVQKHLILEDVPQLLASLRSWVIPAVAPASLSAALGAEDPTTAISSVDPHLTRFSAHVVIFLRQMLSAASCHFHSDWLKTTGDVLIYTYCILLASQRRDPLAAAYARQLLTPGLCRDFFVQLLQLRASDSMDAKQQALDSMILDLPFEGSDSVLAILQEVLRNSREQVAGNTEGLTDWPSAVESDARVRVSLLEWAANDPPPPGVVTSAQREQQQCALNRLAVNQGNLLLRELALASIAEGNTMEGSPSVDAANAIVALLLDRAKWLGALAADVLQGSDALQYSYTRDGRGCDEAIESAMAVVKSARELQFWADYLSADAAYRSWATAIASAAETAGMKDRLGRGRGGEGVTGGSLGLEDELLVLAARGASLALHLLDAEGGLEACLNPESDNRPSEEGSQQVLIACGAILAPNGDVLSADSTVCAAMSDALLSSVREEEGERLGVKVETSSHPSDPRLLVLRLRCDQQGVERQAAGDVQLQVQGSAPAAAAMASSTYAEEEEEEEGESAALLQCEELTSPLVRIMAAAVKGELPRMAASARFHLIRCEAFILRGAVSLEELSQPLSPKHMFPRHISSQLITGSSTDSSLLASRPAPHVTAGLVRACCLPVLALRCMEMRAHAASLFDQSSERSRSSALLTATATTGQPFSRSHRGVTAANGGSGGGGGATDASAAAAKSAAVATELFSSLDAVPVVASGSLHQLFTPAQMQAILMFERETELSCELLLTTSALLEQ